MMARQYGSVRAAVQRQCAGRQARGRQCAAKARCASGVQVRWQAVVVRCGSVAKGAARAGQRQRV